MSTIFARATARGKAGVAVVRISGTEARSGLLRLAAPVEPRRASLRRLEYQGDHLDDALVLWLPGPASFTGEDVVELQLHGSEATVSAVLRVLGEFPGFRPALAGEFTRRALENECLDLAQIEGLADLVEAETEAQRRQALRVLSGAIGARAAVWRRDLIRAAALIEATIDFADEEVPTDVTPEVSKLLGSTLSALRTDADGAAAAERVRDGYEVAIVGPPNVGKSTLLNALAGREAAITSEIAGTTRDVIEVRLEVRGLAVTMLDTAGIRDTSDEIEALGVDRAVLRAEQADLRLILKGAFDEKPVVEPQTGDLELVSKADISRGDFSAVTGQGLDAVLDRIGETLAARASSGSIMIRERHRLAIVEAIRALETAQDRLSTDPDLAELIAEELRAAVRALDSLVGHVDVEHLLDEIFSSFCIGK